MVNGDLGEGACKRTNWERSLGRHLRNLDGVGWLID